MAIAFRGQFYFAAEGHSYFARKGQRRLPSGVKRARLFQLQLLYIVLYHCQPLYNSSTISLTSATIIMAVVGVSGTRAVQKIEQKRFLSTLLKKNAKRKGAHYERLT